MSGIMFSEETKKVLSRSAFGPIIADCMENHHISLKEREAMLMTVSAGRNASNPAIIKAAEAAAQALYLAVLPIVINKAISIWPKCKEMDDYLMDVSSSLLESIKKTNANGKCFTAAVYRIPDFVKERWMKAGKMESTCYISIEELPNDACSGFDNLLDELSAKESRDVIDEVLETLTPREEKVLKLYYGLDGNGALSKSEIGVCFNLTEGRIKQIYDKGLRKMRDPYRADKLKDLLYG